MDSVHEKSTENNKTLSREKRARIQPIREVKAYFEKQEKPFFIDPETRNDPSIEKRDARNGIFFSSET